MHIRVSKCVNVQGIILLWLLRTETAGDVIGKVVEELGGLDILVNNASIQHMCTDLTDITPEQLQETFAINVFGYFYMAQVSCNNTL